jgi:alpha-D-ribose 1-methylphosphonate 5-triphosphate synthase subunit PhnG
MSNPAPDQPPESSAGRTEWMGVLARSSASDVISTAVPLLTDIHFELTRAPQSGLVMVRGRAGGTGAPFNVGEVSVTHCAVRLANGPLGLAYVQGRNHRHAVIAALLGALLQTDRQSELHTALVAPLARKLADRSLLRRRKAAATRVEFFTMARGEEIS